MSQDNNSPEPKLPFARMMHDVNQHELCVLTPGQWKYIRENWESQSRRIAELERQLAKAKADHFHMIEKNERDISHLNRKIDIARQQSETRSVRRTPGHDAYVKHCDSSGIHSNRFPAWSELSAKERAEWEPRDTTARALLDRAIDTISEFHEACEPSEDHESAIAPGNAFRILVDELAKLCYDRRQMDKQLGICPHGMPVNENVCGPCSQGRPNRPPPPPEAPPSVNEFIDMVCAAGWASRGDAQWAGITALHSRLFGKAAQHSAQTLEAEVSTLREHLAEVNRLLSLNVAQVPSPEIRAIFNKAIGVQVKNKFSYGFDTDEAAAKAFEFIAALGELETGKTLPETGDSRG